MTDQPDPRPALTDADLDAAIDAVLSRDPAYGWLDDWIGGPRVTYRMIFEEVRRGRDRIAHLEDVLTRTQQAFAVDAQVGAQVRGGLRTRIAELTAEMESLSSALECEAAECRGLIRERDALRRAAENAVAEMPDSFYRRDLIAALAPPAPTTEET